MAKLYKVSMSIVDPNDSYSEYDTEILDHLNNLFDRSESFMKEREIAKIK